MNFPAWKMHNSFFSLISVFVKLKLILLFYGSPKSGYFLASTKIAISILEIQYCEILFRKCALVNGSNFKLASPTGIVPFLVLIVLNYKIYMAMKELKQRLRLKTRLLIKMIVFSFNGNTWVLSLRLNNWLAFVTKCIYLYTFKE